VLLFCYCRISRYPAMRSKDSKMLKSGMIHYSMNREVLDRSEKQTPLDSGIICFLSS
jgi:hypothetical protein